MVRKVDYWGHYFYQLLMLFKGHWNTEVCERVVVSTILTFGET